MGTAATRHPQNAAKNSASIAKFGARTAPCSRKQFGFRAVSARIDIQNQFPALAELCWPFHQRVIERLEIRVVLCLGRMCGSWVRKRMNATAQGKVFLEKNSRRWKSTSFLTSTGIGVVTASHPSRADWTKPASDPTPFVKKLLGSSHIRR